ncbi:MAG: hypothetical protein Q8P20_08540 [bacterium]|nr:hypothetical protein [bacterium]
MELLNELKRFSAKWTVEVRFIPLLIGELMNKPTGEPIDPKPIWIINTALAASDDSRMMLTEKLYRLWITAAIDSSTSKLGEAKEVFGQNFGTTHMDMVCYTITDDKKTGISTLSVDYRHLIKGPCFHRRTLLTVTGLPAIVKTYDQMFKNIFIGSGSLND